MSTEPLERRDAELAVARGHLALEPSGERLAHALLRTSMEIYRDDPKRSELARKAAEQLDAFKDRRWRDKVAQLAPVRAARNAFDPQSTPAVLAVQKWLASGCKRDLVLRGAVGTGKSSAAAVAVRHWCEPLVAMSTGGDPCELTGSIAPTVSWLRPNALVSAIEHSYDPKAPQLRRFVVIDDWGRETRSEFTEAMTELLDREGHTLLITANMTKAEMRDRYDLRLLDRLNERAQAFDVPGESMRPKGDF